MTPRLRPDMPLVPVTTRFEWRAWLEREHHRSTGVWAVTVTKGSRAVGEPYVSAVDLNAECLCFGWIDLKPARIDDCTTCPDTS